MDEGGRGEKDGSHVREVEGLSSSAEPDGASSSGSTWIPLSGAFRRYKSLQSTVSVKSSTLRIVVGRPLSRLTRNIVETYQLCNPSFKFSETLNLKRFLTNPSIGVLNDDYDNANSDLILHVNFVLVNSDSTKRYIVKDILGQGTFGQVAKCWVSETNSYVAVKIIKNQPAYTQQALVEVSILKTLNQKFDPDDKHHIVRILDCFKYQQHLCISFEMLGPNLYELIRMIHFKGIPLSIVQVFSKQILDALIVMKDAGIIHCDLKPENILLSTSVKPDKIKIIDFGSACMEGRTVYSYIQSRYYRSPEVLLGYPYTTSIDMWSFGCIVAELFLGLPLFPGASEYDILKRMIEILGGQLPDDLLRDAKNTSKFFKHAGSIYHLEDDEACEGSRSAYRLLTEEEYETRESKRPAIGKNYFRDIKLEDIVANYPYSKNLHEEEIFQEHLTRLALVDFLRGLVEFDPGKRWSPLQASRHPFVTGEPFTCPYKPPPETRRIPVIHSVTVDHNPGGGHWLGASLSPQVSNVNRCPPHNSLHYQTLPLSHGSSFGSLGSHGSYNENAGLGSSYGSYGDISTTYIYHSPVGPFGLNIHAQVGLGASPDAGHRPAQFSHGNGFVVSPTGNFVPMSLGASPSQFTPPSSQIQISTVSPGKYGPSSPARGSIHGSPLGKAAVASKYNRRRSWGCPGISSMQPQESSSQHWQGNHVDGISCSHPDANSQGHSGSSRSALPTSSRSNRRQQLGGGNGISSGFSSTNHHNLLVSHAVNSSVVPSHATEVSSDKPDCSSAPPDPGDWDPNYSDELLLQEDNSEVSSLASGVTNAVRLGHSIDAAIPASGIGGVRSGHNRVHAGSNFISANQRRDGPFPDHWLAESIPPPSHDIRVGYSQSKFMPPHHLPHFSQNSPTRFGQQPVHRFNHMHSTFIPNEWNHHKGQSSLPNYNTTDSRSPANSMEGNDTSRGRRARHPLATNPPSSHSRKDYGRIS